MRAREQWTDIPNAAGNQFEYAIGKHLSGWSIFLHLRHRQLLFENGRHVP